MAQLKRHFSNFHPWIVDLKIKQTFIFLVMISIQRLVFAMMSMKMNGLSRSFLITQVTNSFSAQHQLLWIQQKFWLLVEARHQRKMQEFISRRKMRFWTRHKWPRVEMRMPSQSAKVPYLSSVDSLASKDFAQLRNTTSKKTNGIKSLRWRTRDITWVHVL